MYNEIIIFRCLRIKLTMDLIPFSLGIFYVLGVSGTFLIIFVVEPMFGLLEYCIACIDPKNLPPQLHKA